MMPSLLLRPSCFSSYSVQVFGQYSSRPESRCTAKSWAQRDVVVHVPHTRCRSWSTSGCSFASDSSLTANCAKRCFRRSPLPGLPQSVTSSDRERPRSWAISPTCRSSIRRSSDISPARPARRFMRVISRLITGNSFGLGDAPMAPAPSETAALEFFCFGRCRHCPGPPLTPVQDRAENHEHAYDGYGNNQGICRHRCSPLNQETACHGRPVLLLSCIKSGPHEPMETVVDPNQRS